MENADRRGNCLSGGWLSSTLQSATSRLRRKSSHFSSGRETLRFGRNGGDSRRYGRDRRVLRLRMLCQKSSIRWTLRIPLFI